MFFEGKAMTGDTVHELSEFVNFPWERLTDDWFATCGLRAVHTGGVVADVDFNAPGRRSWIGFYDKNGAVDAWEIPPQLASLIVDAHDRGKDHIRRVFRNLLELEKL